VATAIKLKAARDRKLEAGEKMSQEASDRLTRECRQMIRDAHRQMFEDDVLLYTILNRSAAVERLFADAEAAWHQTPREYVCRTALLKGY
jgi:hypothetical protein